MKFGRLYFTPLDEDGQPDHSRTVDFAATTLRLTHKDGTTQLVRLTEEPPIMAETTITDAPKERPTRAAMDRLEAELRANQSDIQSLRRQLEQERERTKAAKTEADDWRAVKVADPEAEALSGCIRAIDVMRSASNVNLMGSSIGSSSYSYGQQPVHIPAEATPVGRILLHLAARYDIPIVDAPPPRREDVTVLVDPGTAARLIDDGLARHG
jgi:hypothetical protein